MGVRPGRRPDHESDDPPVATPPPATPAPGGSASAGYRTTSAWPGGFQGEVTVSAGSSPINGWTIGWTLASGQTIGLVWNGTLSVNGSAVTVRNASYNGSPAANASTTFGFIAFGLALYPCPDSDLAAARRAGALDGFRRLADAV